LDLIMPAGTRFRLFPQHPSLSSTREPETIWLSSPPGTIGPGPSDGRMYTILPLGKRPYGDALGPYGTPYLYFPPWTGPVLPPALPGPDGHFDHLPPGTPEFDAAHLFGCVRFALDIWEKYFGRPIPWHFADRYERLEMAPVPDFDNAHAGYGFLEVGQYPLDSGARVPFILNFDIIAHELGHLIISTEVGQPTDATAGGEYYGFHESAADLVGLLASAHFESVIDPLLENTRGNLYVYNLFNRIGEVSDNQQIRLAGNGVRLSEFVDGWTGEHDLSLPLTGAMFDILVDVFHDLLLGRRLISPQMEQLMDAVERAPEYQGVIQDLFDQAYDHDQFREAFLGARDYLGLALAATWQRLSPQRLSYQDVFAALLDVDRELSGARFHKAIRTNFLWREIGVARVGPRLAPDRRSHAHSARTLRPDDQRGLARMPYREQWFLAREHCLERR
jgi:hypothetical protein